MTALFTTSLGGHNELIMKWKSSSCTYFALSHLANACFLDMQIVLCSMVRGDGMQERGIMFV